MPATTSRDASGARCRENVISMVSYSAGDSQRCSRKTRWAEARHSATAASVSAGVRSQVASGGPSPSPRLSLSVAAAVTVQRVRWRTVPRPGAAGVNWKAAVPPERRSM